MNSFWLHPSLILLLGAVLLPLVPRGSRSRTCAGPRCWCSRARLSLHEREFSAMCISWIGRWSSAGWTS